MKCYNVLSEQGPGGLHHPGSTPAMGLPNFPVSGTSLTPSLGQECHAQHPAQHTSTHPGYRGVFGIAWLKAYPGNPPSRGRQPTSLDGANACLFPSSRRTRAVPEQRAPGCGDAPGTGGVLVVLRHRSLGVILVLPLIVAAMRKMFPCSPLVSRLLRGRGWAQHVAGCVPGVLMGMRPSYCCSLRGWRR